MSEDLAKMIRELYEVRDTSHQDFVRGVQELWSKSGVELIDNVRMISNDQELVSRLADMIRNDVVQSHRWIADALDLTPFDSDEVVVRKMLDLLRDVQDQLADLNPGHGPRLNEQYRDGTGFDN